MALPTYGDARPQALGPAMMRRLEEPKRPPDELAVLRLVEVDRVLEPRRARLSGEEQSMVRDLEEGDDRHVVDRADVPRVGQGLDVDAAEGSLEVTGGLGVNPGRWKASSSRAAGEPVDSRSPTSASKPP
jgi:hypothetical protein